MYSRQIAIMSFTFSSVSKMKGSKPCFMRTCFRRSLVKAFFSPVTASAEPFFVVLAISFSVIFKFEESWSMVSAKALSKTCSLKGKWSTSARTREIVFIPSCLTWASAILKSPLDKSTPTM